MTPPPGTGGTDLHPKGTDMSQHEYRTTLERISERVDVLVLMAGELQADVRALREGLTPEAARAIEGGVR